MIYIDQSATAAINVCEHWRSSTFARNSKFCAKILSRYHLFI